MCGGKEHVGILCAFCPIVCLSVCVCVHNSIALKLGLLICTLDFLQVPE